MADGEIDVGESIWAMAFSASGEHLLSSGEEAIQVWRVADRQRVATIHWPDVQGLTVSKDGRWIAGATYGGDVVVWDATTYRQNFVHREGEVVYGVDFAPNATRLVVASWNFVAKVLDVTNGEQVQTFHHSWRVVSAKYSAQGDRIATATAYSVHLWDATDGRPLMDFSDVTVTPQLNNGGLHWLDDDLFVVSGGTIKQFNTSTGSVLREWIVPDTGLYSSLALPNHQEFIVYSEGDSVTSWDMVTYTLLGRVPHHPRIRSIALSPDDRLLAIGALDGIIIFKDIKDGLPSTYATAAFIDITDTIHDSWKQGRLAETEALLTDSISKLTHEVHHALANRALLRSQLNRCDLAIDDSENSISIRPSAIGYIAKSVALIRSGKKVDGCRVLDLAFRYCDPIHLDHLLLIKAIVLFMAGKYDEALSRIGDLIAAVRLYPVYYLVQAYMYFLLGNSQMERTDYESAIYYFKRARTHTEHRATFDLFDVSLISGWKFDDLSISVRRRLCEVQCTAGRLKDAGESLLELVDTFGEGLYTSGPMTKWVSDFTKQCLSVHEVENITSVEDVATKTPLLREWAKATLACLSWKNALVVAARFAVPTFMVYQVICERLEAVDRTNDASECFRQMVANMMEQNNIHDTQAEWVLWKLEGLGDANMKAKLHGDAISNFSAALSLRPASQHLFIKRSKAYLACGVRERALNDANKAIKLDPSSPWGYETKHAVLHRAGDYENAIDAFEMMLSRMSQSTDPEIRDCHHRYIAPGETRRAIRKVIEGAICDSPRVLINTISGRLLDKHEQASAFESHPIFNKLVSSTTTQIDRARIERDVVDYYRYAMFSHKWEDNEPLFNAVIRTVVYELEGTLTNDKLRTFCEIVKEAGLNWAWSDTCCINKADHLVLQEALVAMFKWYQGSSLTVVYLRDAPWRRLVDSIWNSRAWTFQEYHASRVVRFYNSDWTPYRNLDIHNHKESPEVISEMEDATGISARALMGIRSGLDDIRQKLCLASTRKTTLVEDAAYSLLGMFSVSLPILYGEGDQALGKLLAQLLPSSGDTSILAWTGKSGSFNSCLPGRIAVFKELPASHIPLSITDTEMTTITDRLRRTLPDLTSVTRFYDQLNALPVPSFIGKRIKLPCVVFKLGRLSVSSGRSGQIFRAQTDALAIVEIRSTGRDDICGLKSLYLVHPWVDFLLDRRPVGSDFGTIPEEDVLADDQASVVSDPPAGPLASNATLAKPDARSAQFVPRFRLPFGRAAPRRRLGDPASLRPPSDASLHSNRSFVESLRPPSTLGPSDKEMLALRAIARLRQPFGALLLTPDLGNVSAYRRVAAESLLTVQVGEVTQAVLDKLVDRVRVLDVL